MIVSDIPLAESPLAVPGALLCAWLHMLQTFPRCFRTRGPQAHTFLESSLQFPEWT